MTQEETAPLKSITQTAPIDGGSGVEFTTQEDEPVRSNEYQAFTSLFKSYVTLGILCIPYSSRQVGTVPSTIMSIGCCFFVFYATYIVCEMSHHKQKRFVSLAEIAADEFGEIGATIMNIIILFIQFMVAIGVILIARFFFDSFFCYYEVTSMCDTIWVTFVVTYAILLPMSFINNIHYLYMSSAVANFIIMGSVVTLTGYCIYLLALGEVHTDQFGLWNWRELPQFYGVAMAAYEGITIIPQIRESLIMPEHISKIVSWVQIILLPLYTLFPIVCNLAFPPDIKDIVLLSLPFEIVIFVALILLYAIASILTYPLAIPPIIHIFEESPTFSILFEKSGRDTATIKQVIGRVFLMTFFFIIAITMPDMHTFMEIIGTMVSHSFVVYIIILYLYWPAKQHSKLSVILHALICIVTSFIAAVGFINGMRNYIYQHFWAYQHLLVYHTYILSCTRIHVITSLATITLF
eukprot:TRINITY_DN6980_c0_g1_i5.p1 TRINITY_DN6980_c0_g1~~TRINITY_DN6980_c0_g1_i5.p1  ORF type:complete len:465 (-),score=39.52 TRINITY_DN6980_c0_g1_i5:164-1558(-)